MVLKCINHHKLRERKTAKTHVPPKPRHRPNNNHLLWQTITNIHIKRALHIHIHSWDHWIIAHFYPLLLPPPQKKRRELQEVSLLCPSFLGFDALMPSGRVQSSSGFTWDGGEALLFKTAWIFMTETTITYRKKLTNRLIKTYKNISNLQVLETSWRKKTCERFFFHSKIYKYKDTGLGPNYLHILMRLVLFVFRRTLVAEALPITSLCLGLGASNEHVRFFMIFLTLL